MSGEQWAKLPESAAYMGLDATAHSVLIIMAAKAGRDRTAWITQQTIAERLDLGRTTIGKAIRRLEKLDLVRKSGRVVVDHERGTWVQKYKVAPYLPEVTRGVTSGVGEDGPDVTLEGPDGTSGLPDVTLVGPDVADQARLATHSVPTYQSLSISPSVSAETVGEEQERQQGRTEEEERKGNARAAAKAFREEQARRLGRRRGLVLEDPEPDPRTSASASASEARVGEDV